jgi:hypothetical protein
MHHFGTKTTSSRSHFENDSYPHISESVSSYSGLFTFLVGWHASAVCLPPSDVTLAQLACPLNDVILCLLLE